MYKVCSNQRGNRQTDRQTHRTTTVTFMHAPRVNKACTMVVTSQQEVNKSLIDLLVGQYSEAMKFYMIMPASLATASFEYNERSREDSYSAMHYAEYYANDQWAGLTALIVGGAIECLVSS